jgi:hypothetical protein
MLFSITNPTLHGQHNLIKVDINFSCYYMTTCADHITAIFRPTINIKMYTILVCIHFYTNNRPENVVIWSKHVALE